MITENNSSSHDNSGPDISLDRKLPDLEYAESVVLLSEDCQVRLCIAEYLPSELCEENIYFD